MDQKKEETSMATERQARVVWEGDLRSGKGDLSLVSSGAGQFPVTFASRIEQPEGRTSPEELLAASHASCFSMALSNILAQGGNPPQRVEVTATVGIERKESGLTVTHSALEVRGVVPGIDQAKFAEAAEQAAQGCPISKALKGNVEITVNATLAS